MKKTRKRFMSLFLAIALVIGLIPCLPMTSVKAGGPGENWGNPILIDSMDKLIDELSKDTSEEQITYYRLTEDVSYDTRLEKFMGAESDPNEEDAAKIDYKTLSQCVVGKGKKNLELMGHDIHYKNNINIGQHFNKDSCWRFKEGWKKIDSLTFFYLPEGANLTVSNTTKESGQIWYDGRMNDRTGFFDGPRYTFTAVRDVFRVEAGAELTLNNTDVKAGRNRKIWMLNSYYISKEPETNLIASLTWVGYAYEQIYGSCVVVNGGKVTINGGLFDARGGYRDGYNVIGGDKEYYDNAFMIDPYYFKTDNMIKEFLTNIGPKAAVQIAGEGSQVIINDGEFWGNGGANAIGINTLNGKWRDDVTDYQLEIHAGTFDTAKTDKERLPDHCSEMSGNGIFYTVAENFDMWGDCRVTRDTPRGYIGIPARDGKGNPVVDLSKSRIYVDEEDPEDEITSTDEANFLRKSDSDTIIIRPKKQDTYFSNTTNYLGQKAFAIYATDASDQNIIGSNFEGGNQTLKYDKDQGTHLWYTAESMFNLSDENNRLWYNMTTNVNCTWTLYEVTLDSNNKVKNIETTTSVVTPTYTYVEDGKLLYMFKCDLDNWQRTARSSYEWKQDAKVRYYMRASATEIYADSLQTYFCQMDNSDEFNYGQEREYAGGLFIDYQVSFQNNLDHPEFAVDYANARYGSSPKITLSKEMLNLKDQYNACFKYQWQILKDGVWEDYGVWKISIDDVAWVLNQHYDLLGETLRLKITEYDNKIKGAVYSKERVVTKGGSVGDDPIVPAIDVTADPNHEGKYVFHIQVDSDAQEYLVVSDETGLTPSRRIPFLDWSTATVSKEIDNLDYGAYVVYTRYPATDTTEAGTKVAYCSAFAKVTVETEDIQISYVTRANSYTPTRNQPILSSGDDFATYVDGGVRYFIVESIPYGANDGVAKNTQWWCSNTEIIQPMKLQRSGRSFVWAECEWGDDTKGNTFAFKGIQEGKVELHANTTLLNGTVKDTVINVYVMPDASTPYKITTTAEGETVKLMPGQSYEPQLVVYPDTVQPNSDKLLWVRSKSTSAQPGVSVNTKTGVVTVGDNAQIGEVSTIRGTYSLGKGKTPITFMYQVEVIASDEISANAHPGKDHEFTTFRPYDESQHLQICACGETAYAGHEFRDMVIRQATNTETGILRHICEDCGYYYEETIPVGVHIHEPYWNYDESEHWQNCEGESCTEDNYEVNRGTHTFEKSGVTDYGQPIYTCSVCGAIQSLGEGEMVKELTAGIAHTCTVGNGLALNYYVDCKQLDGMENIRLVVKKKKYNADGSVYEWKTHTITNYSVGNTGLHGEKEYKFTFSGIFAYEMGDELVAKVVAEKDGQYYQSDEDKYCIKTYAINNMKKTTTSENLKTLLADMLIYGAEAQVYFKYHTDELVTSEMTEEMWGYATTGTPKLTAFNESETTENAKARFNGRTLIAGNQIELKYYMLFDDMNMDNVSLKLSYTAIGGEPHETVIPASMFGYDSEANEYSAKIATIAVKDFGCEITAAIYDGSTLISDVNHYSIGTYINNQLKKTSISAELKTFLAAMGRYGISAENYFKPAD